MYYGIQKGAIEALCLDSSWYRSMNKIYKKEEKLFIKFVIS